MILNYLALVTIGFQVTRRQKYPAADYGNTARWLPTEFAVQPGRRVTLHCLRGRSQHLYLHADR